jgi:hypothetical protein
MWPIPTISSNLQEPESQRMPDHSDGSREAQKREGNITADISVQVSTLFNSLAGLKIQCVPAREYRMVSYPMFRKCLSQSSTPQENSIIII